MKLKMLAALAVAMLVGLAAAPAAQAEVMKSPLWVSGGQPFAFCMDVNTSTNKLALWTCHGGANQNFFTSAYGPQRFNGLCLDQASNNQGADVVLTPCVNRPSQRWGMQQSQTGLVTLKNEAGWCVDIPGGTVYQGQRVEIWSCNSGANQTWKFGSNQAAAAPAPAPAPVASAPSGVCSDAWMTQAIRAVANRAPSGSARSGECDPSRYGRGQWSSYRDLLNKVAVRFTNKGAVYVFIAPRMAIIQGHIGWAYTNDDGTYSYGATDAPNAGPAIMPGVRSNTPWRGQASTEQELFLAFKSHYANDTYNEFKHSFVANRNTGGATRIAAEEMNWGYTLVGNNCLDHTYKVLAAYGAQEGVVMQWMQTHPAPNSWFRAFGRMDLNGAITRIDDAPGDRI